MSMSPIVATHITVSNSSQLKSHEGHNILKPESGYLIDWWCFDIFDVFVENFKAVRYLHTTLNSQREPMISNRIHDKNKKHCWRAEKFCSISPGIPSKNALEPWAKGGDFITRWAIPSNASNQLVHYDVWLVVFCSSISTMDQSISMDSFLPMSSSTTTYNNHNDPVSVCECLTYNKLDDLQCVQPVALVSSGQDFLNRKSLMRLVPPVSGHQRLLQVIFPSPWLDTHPPSSSHDSHTIGHNARIYHLSPSHCRRLIKNQWMSSSWYRTGIVMQFDCTRCTETVGHIYCMVY